jgi:hypothetical protein
VQTISPSEAMQSARPLGNTPQVNKTSVWLLLCGSASVLFAATLLAENRTPLFPAITRANRAMAVQRDIASQESLPIDTAANTATELHEEAEVQSATEDAFLKGMQAARGRASQKD